jgi:hypothetical protein
VPIGALGLLAAFAWIDESRDTASGQRLDLIGLVLSALGLFALTYALIDANRYGWGSTRIVSLFALALGLRKRDRSSIGARSCASTATNATSSTCS